MQIETYEIEESKEELALLAADSEAIELIDKLGLAGQKKLSNGKTVTRFPYRKMTKEESSVYGLLFPKRSLLEDYSDGIIPVRVLQVAAHAKETGFLSKMVVWHPENADIPDPILVGSRPDPVHSWIEEVFILARWGTALESLEVLAKKAKAVWLNKVKADLARAKARIEADAMTIASFEKLDVIPNLNESIVYSGL